MDKPAYRKISKYWKGKIYQEWRRMPERLEMLAQNSHYFKGKNVLEFGCNAGLFCFEIMNHAKSYVGVEKNPVYYAQALVTKKHIKNERVEFLRMTAKEYMKNPRKIDAFFSAYLLYHLDDEEISMLRETVFPKCEVAMSFIRGKGDKELKHNKYRLWIPENVKKLMDVFPTVEIVGTNPYLVIGRK